MSLGHLLTYLRCLGLDVPLGWDARGQCHHPAPMQAALLQDQLVKPRRGCVPGPAQLCKAKWKM